MPTGQAQGTRGQLGRGWLPGVGGVSMGGGCLPSPQEVPMLTFQCGKCFILAACCHVWHRPVWPAARFTAARRGKHPASGDGHRLTPPPGLSAHGTHPALGSEGFLHLLRHEPAGTAPGDRNRGTGQTRMTHFCEGSGHHTHRDNMHRRSQGQGEGRGGE